MKKTKTDVKILWSIHKCAKFTSNKTEKTAGLTTGYMTVRTEGGRKKIREMHDTLGSALKEVGE